MKSALDARGWRRSFSRLCSTLLKCNRANIAIMFGLMAPVFVGMLGAGMETAMWYTDQRNIQNASDAAALAAAADGTSNYSTVASAVAAQYGISNGAGSEVVTSSNTASCPSGGNTCYSVSITMKQPLYILQAFGYTGNTTYNGSPAQNIQASATAQSATVTHKYCLLTLATTSSSLRTNGAASANLAGCSIMSDGGATCNGHNLGADYGDAAGTNNGCGVVESSNDPVVPDPYAHYATYIPSNPCSSYANEDKKGNGAAQQWTGTVNLSGNTVVCGDLQLSGNVTLTGSGTIVIENGQLDSSNYTIQTANGATVTVVFSGTNSGSYTRGLTGNGTFNIQAPTSGNWSGVAVYEDPNVTSGFDVTYTGNSPTWDITGLVYMPNANVTFKGAVNKSSYGASCFVMVSYTLLVSGTADILETGGCPQAGLAMPTNQIPGGQKLVY